MVFCDTCATVFASSASSTVTHPGKMYSVSTHLSGDGAYSKPVPSEGVYCRSEISEHVYSRSVLSEHVYNKPVFSEHVYSSPEFSEHVFSRSVLGGCLSKGWDTNISKPFLSFHSSFLPGEAHDRSQWDMPEKIAGTLINIIRTRKSVPGMETRR